MMHCCPRFAGILSLLLVIACSTPRTTLLCLLLTALLLLSTHLFAACLAHVRLPCSCGTAAAFSVSIGFVLCPALQLLFGHAACLSPTRPLTAAVLLCAGAAIAEDDTPSPCLPPVLLLLGSLREWMSAGSLWGVQLTDFRPLPSLENTAGGLLLAAVVTGIVGLNRPVVTTRTGASLLADTVFVLAGTALGHLAVSVLPLSYSFLVVTLFVGFSVAALPAPLAPDEWLLAAPLAVFLVPVSSWPAIPVGSLLFAVLLLLISGWHQRCRLSGAPARFSGLPTALGIAGIGCCVFQAL